MKPANCNPRIYLRALTRGFYPLGVMGFVRVCLEDEHLAVDICPYHLDAKSLWPHLQAQDWWSDEWIVEFISTTLDVKFGRKVPAALYHILIDDDGKEILP